MPGMRKPQALPKLTDDHRQSWDNVFNDPLLSVERMKQKGLAGDIGGTDARSLYWKVWSPFLDPQVPGFPCDTCSQRFILSTSQV